MIEFFDGADSIYYEFTNPNHDDNYNASEIRDQLYAQMLGWA